MATSSASLKVLTLVLVLSLVNFSMIVSGVVYVPLLTKDCVADAYRQVLSGLTVTQCGAECFKKTSSTGFTMSGEECHLFNFTKTTDNVPTCNVNEKKIWFKKNAVETMNSPTGFGHEFNRVVYKIETTLLMNYTEAVAHCRSLGHNVRLADALNLEEFYHLGNIVANSSVNEAWVDAFQIPGSVEPDQGWIWAIANVPILMTSCFWFFGEPNNEPNRFGYIIVNVQHAIIEKSAKKLKDRLGNDKYAMRCKCCS